ncbi:MAG: HAD family hydrolase [Myxococcales bacterium]
MATAAFFDLDGTLLTVNSAHLWIRRERRLGRMHAGHAAQALWMLARYRVGLLDMETLLRWGLRRLRGVSEDTVRRETHEWWREEVRQYVAPGARAVLQRHRRAGDQLVLLTSSSAYASEMARDEFGLDAILYQGYEVVGGRFTGNPSRPLCYGDGKVEIAAAWAREQGVDLAASSFYSDSSTDVPMLERVAHPFVVHPDPRLRFIALARRWPRLDWRG